VCPLVLWTGAALAAAPFTDATTEVGLDGIENTRFQNPGGQGGGLSVLDYDQDGRFDLYLVRADLPNLLLRNLGGTFVDVTAGDAAAEDRTWIGSSTADVDGDGWPDLLLLGVGGSRLLRNEQGQGFEVVAGTGLDAAGWPTHSAAWGDLDRDGDLDLYSATHARHSEYFGGGPPEPETFPDDVCVENHLFIQVAPLVFEDQAAALGVDNDGCTLSVAATDLDEDGWLDLYATNDFGPFVTRDGLYWNQGVDEDGELRPFLEDPDVAPPILGMCVAPADYDRDADLDFFLSNTISSKLFQSLGSAGAVRTFVEVSRTVGIDPVDRQIAWSCAIQDFDHDGWPDIFALNATPPASLYWSQGGSSGVSFAHDLTTLPLPVEGKGSQYAGVAFDLDDDGDLDLVTCGLGGHEGLSEGDTCYVYRNELDSGAHWLQLELVPASGEAEPYGARVRVEAGGETWWAERSGGSGYASGVWRVLHFGLGEVSTPATVTVTWPDGVDQTWEGVALDARHRLERDRGGDSGDSGGGDSGSGAGGVCGGCGAVPVGGRALWGAWALVWRRPRPREDPSIAR